MKIHASLGAVLMLAGVACGQSDGTTSAAQAPAQPTHAAKPGTPIYDEQADAKTVIAAALAKAKKENRRVLIQWGANWCGWCTILHDTFKKDKTLAHELLYEYDVVHVDIGRSDKNLDLAEMYGAKFRDKDNGVPYLTVLDADGKVLANQATGPLEKPSVKNEDGTLAMGYQIDMVQDFLKKHEAKSLAADDVLKRGLAEASAEDKVVLLHFGAPWCGWCHKMEDWMARPEIAAILDKAFVDVKVDVDRMIGGKDVFAKFNSKSEKSGIPWFVFLSPDGKALADSTAPEGNTGFPYQDSEIAHFEAMLKKTKLSEADTQTLVASLKAGREKK